MDQRLTLTRSAAAGGSADKVIRLDRADTVGGGRFISVPFAHFTIGFGYYPCRHLSLGMAREPLVLQSPSAWIRGPSELDLLFQAFLTHRTPCLSHWTVAVRRTAPDELRWLSTEYQSRHELAMRGVRQRDAHCQANGQRNQQGTKGVSARQGKFFRDISSFPSRQAA